MKMQRMYYTNLLGQRAMMMYWNRLRSDARGEFVIDTLLPGIPLYVTATRAGKKRSSPCGRSSRARTATWAPSRSRR